MKVTTVVEETFANSAYIRIKFDEDPAHAIEVEMASQWTYLVNDESLIRMKNVIEKALELREAIRMEALL